MRLGDLDKLKEELDRPFWEKWEWAFICKCIDNAPTVPLPDFKEGYKQAILDGQTIVERSQGEWIKKVDNVGFISHICSECGAEIELEDPCDNKFCFNCGASMGGKNGLPLQKNDRNS